MALITITFLFQMPNPNQQPPSNALSSEVETLYDPQTIAPPKNNLQSEVCEKDGCTEYHAVETHVRNGKFFLIRFLSFHAMLIFRLWKRHIYIH